ncbi:MAG: hypothetical protein LBK71_00035 [Verrucomicrobiales bacterium]|jgi:hypothetical protein|nr:hypothetical protein [Verrucomicrobiales bacterium]
MFGFSKASAPGKRKKKRSNLEFDFITGPAPGSRPAAVKKAPTLTIEPAPVAPAPAAAPRDEPPPAPRAATPPAASRPDFTDVHHEPQPSTEEPPSMTSPFNEPAPIRATESIRRQKKEQAAVNTMLNGVVIGIICAIVLVTILAGTGSYVLWKQIQGQSATIAQLESNTSARFAELQVAFQEEHKKLAAVLALTGQQILDLNKQLADAQKTIELLRRSQAQIQRRQDNQDLAIERLRSRPVR